MKYKQQLPENCHSANTNTLVESGFSRGKVYVDKKNSYYTEIFGI